MYDFSKQLFPKLLAAGQPLYGARLGGLWKDIGRPHDLLDANILMAERRGRAIEVAGAECNGRIVATSFSAGGCRIDGPAYIGGAVSIGHGARLSSCAVGSGTDIGDGSEVSGSFLMEGCSLGSHCQIAGSLLGDNVTVGDGAVLRDCVLGDGVRVERGAKLQGQTLE